MEPGTYGLRVQRCDHSFVLVLRNNSVPRAFSLKNSTRTLTILLWKTRWGCGVVREVVLYVILFSPHRQKPTIFNLIWKFGKKRITFNTHNITRLFSNGFTILNTYSITVFCGNLCGIWSMPGHFTTKFLPKGEHRHFAGHSVISQDTARHRTKMIGLRGTCIVIDKLYEK